MEKLPPCPKCQSPYVYEDQNLLACPECSHSWNEQEEEKNNQENLDPLKSIKDANGKILCDGDTVVVIKDLKIKGSSNVVKVGTKVKNIRLVEGDHDIDCKISGVGAMKLKSQFVKKV